MSFIAESVTELALLARRHKFGVLVRLLDMAKMEGGARPARNVRKLS